MHTVYKPFFCTQDLDHRRKVCIPHKLPSLGILTQGYFHVTTFQSFNFLYGSNDHVRYKYKYIYVYVYLTSIFT